MNEIKFSILIPVYNVEKYLRECLNSVLKQSYDNFEVILINDGSTDSSLYICEEYAKKDSRIKVFSQNNQGLIMTRRKGFKEASGDYYICLDSDDYLDLNTLEIMNETINQTLGDLIIYRYKRVDSSKNIVFETKSPFNHKKVFDESNKEILFKEIIQGSGLNNLVCKVIKSSVIDDTNYYKYKDIKNAEDLLQSLPIIYKSKKIVYIDNPLYNYRITENSITQKLNLNKYKDISIVRELVLDYMKKLNIDSEENLMLFYNFYIKSILKFTIELIECRIPKIEKIKIIKEISNIKLFKNAIEYIDINKLPMMYKLELKIYMYKKYNYIYTYLVILSFLKKTKNIIKT